MNEIALIFIANGTLLLTIGVFHRRFQKLKPWKRMTDEQAFIMFFLYLPSTMFLIVSLVGRIVGGW